MSAKDLEDFISLIDAAEKINSANLRKAENLLSVKQTKPNSTASVVSSSSPTDIFTRKQNMKRNQGSRVSSATTPRIPTVPKLWDAKASTDFLGSSWGSTVTNTSTKMSAVSQKSEMSTRASSAKERKISQQSSGTIGGSLATSSTPSSSSSPSKSSQASSVVRVSLNGNDSKSNEETIGSNINPLIKLQQHSKFARVQAKDLSPTVTPNGSPQAARKKPEKRQRGDEGKENEPSSSPESKTTEKPSRRKQPLSSTSKTTLMQKSSSSSKTITSSSSTTRESTEKRFSSSSPDRASNDQDFDLEAGEDQTPRSPPPLPKPQPKITIRQSSVQMHVHSSSPTKERIFKPKARKSPARLIQKRARSASNLKETQMEEMVDLRNFSKSLKLLGLEIASNRREATRLTHQEVNIRTKSPTLKTRLKERTQSIADLQETIDSKEKLAKKEFDEIREALSRAVFEEWYFRKAEKLKEEKLRNQAEKSYMEDDESDDESNDQKESAFSRWLNRKRAEMLAKKEKEELEKAKEEESKAEKEEKVKKAQAEWLEKKNKEMQKKQRKQRMMIEEKKEAKRQLDVKKEEAKKHFEAWRAKVDEFIKAKAEKAKEEKEEQKKKREEEVIEKKNDADAAFAAWKQKKQEEMQLAIQNKESIRPVHKKTEEEEQRRIQEAQKAYEAWLDTLEEREAVEHQMEEIQLYHQAWRPPWYPPGTADV